MDEILKNLPPSSVNNARAIVREKYKQFQKHPCEKLAEEIKALTGAEYDWSDKDHGEPPAQFNK